MVTEIVLTGIQGEESVEIGIARAEERSIIGLPEESSLERHASDLEAHWWACLACGGVRRPLRTSGASARSGLGRARRTAIPEAPAGGSAVPTRSGAPSSHRLPSTDARGAP